VALPVFVTTSIRQISIADLPTSSSEQLGEGDKAGKRGPAAVCGGAATARAVPPTRRLLADRGSSLAGVTMATGRSPGTRPRHQPRRPGVLHVSRRGRPREVVETVVVLPAVAMIGEPPRSRSDERHQDETMHVSQALASVDDLERDQAVALLVRPTVDQLVATADAAPRGDVIGGCLRNGSPELQFKR
jgi:hypothetical protein